MHQKIQHLLHNPKHNSKTIEYLQMTASSLDVGMLKVPSFTDKDFPDAKQLLSKGNRHESTKNLLKPSASKKELTAKIAETSVEEENETPRIKIPHKIPFQGAKSQMLVKASLKSSSNFMPAPN